MAMTIHELRIGNWVLIDYVECYSAKVTTVSDREGIIVNTSTRVADSIVKPIPITPEILEKCGFKKGDEMWLKIDDNHSITYRYGKLLLECDDCYYNIHMGYEHLHQLQNLYFALTGEELNVEL